MFVSALARYTLHDDLPSPSPGQQALTTAQGLQAAAQTCADRRVQASALEESSKAAQLLRVSRELYAELESKRADTVLIDILSELCSAWKNAMLHGANDTVAVLATCGPLLQARDPQLDDRVLSDASRLLSLFHSDLAQETDGAAESFEGLTDLATACRIFTPALPLDAHAARLTHEIASCVTNLSAEFLRVHSTFSRVMVSEVQKALSSNDRGIKVAAAELLQLSKLLSQWRLAWEANGERQIAVERAIGECERDVAVVLNDETKLAKTADPSGELGWEEAYEWEHQREVLVERRAQLLKTDARLRSEREQLLQCRADMVQNMSALAQRWGELVTYSGREEDDGSQQQNGHLLMSAFNGLFETVDSLLVRLSELVMELGLTLQSVGGLDAGAMLITPVFDRHVFFCEKAATMNAVFEVSSSARPSEPSIATHGTDDSGVRTEMMGCLLSLINGWCLDYARRAANYTCERVVCVSWTSLGGRCPDQNGNDELWCDAWEDSVLTLRNTHAPRRNEDAARSLVCSSIMVQRLERQREWVSEHVDLLQHKQLEHKTALFRLVWLNGRSLRTAMRGKPHQNQSTHRRRQQQQQQQQQQQHQQLNALMSTEHTHENFINELREVMGVLASAQGKFVAMTDAMHRILGEVKALLQQASLRKSPQSQEWNRERAAAVCEWDASVANHLDVLGRVLSHLNQAVRLVSGLLSLESSLIDCRGHDGELDAREAAIATVVARFSATRREAAECSRNKQRLGNESTAAASRADAAHRDSERLGMECRRLSAPVTDARLKVDCQARLFFKSAQKLIPWLSEPTNAEATTWRQLEGLIDTLAQVTSTEVAGCEVLGLGAIRGLNHDALATVGIVRCLQSHDDRLLAALGPFIQHAEPFMGVDAGATAGTVDDEQLASVARFSEELIGRLDSAFEACEGRWPEALANLPNMWKTAYEKVIKLTVVASRLSTLEGPEAKADDDQSEDEEEAADAVGAGSLSNPAMASDGRDAARAPSTTGAEVRLPAQLSTAALTEDAVAAPVAPASMSGATTAPADHSGGGGGGGSAGSSSQSRNLYAVSVLKRVKGKLEGRYSTERVTVGRHVDWLIEQATREENLCRMYEGWSSWI